MNETLGEYLADLANGISPNRITIVETTGSKESDELALSVVKLALVLRSKPVLMLRSIVESWDIQRINRELY